MRWAEIGVATSQEAADLIANILIEEGCGGVAITDPSVRAFKGPEATVVTGYLPVDDRIEGRIESIRTRIDLLPETGTPIGAGQITIRWVEETDWAEAWKSFFKPVEIGRILVKPSWEETGPKPGQVVVEIDPGMAFGTGNHPTTRLCLLALQSCVRGGDKVLDVGTGSGILAIAAAKLGADTVTATEVDPVAAGAAEKNVLLNGVGDRVRVIEAESPASAGPVDLAVANITADAIIGLAPALAKVVRPGGTLIASGLIDERSNEVAACLESSGFEAIEKMADDGWAALIMRRSLDCGG